MPVKRPPLINGEYYHIILRGVESRKIFLEKEDNLRFLNDLISFNDELVILDNLRRFLKFKKQCQLGGYNKILPKRQLPPKKALIEILAICLMPTHVHLLVKQISENGISLFFQKMGGYATYFNKKYHRIGSLFQRPFKAIHIKNQKQLETVICYIHANPIELIEPNWKEDGIKNLKKTESFIENYAWSSFGAILGKENIISLVINKNLLDQVTENPRVYKDWIKGKLFQKANFKDIINILE